MNMFSSRATVVLFNSGYILGWQLSACGAVFCKHVKKTIFHARHVSGSLHDLSPHALAAGMKENLTLN